MDRERRSGESIRRTRKDRKRNDRVVVGRTGLEGRKVEEEEEELVLGVEGVEVIVW